MQDFMHFCHECKVRYFSLINYLKYLPMYSKFQHGIQSKSVKIHTYKAVKNDVKMEYDVFSMVVLFGNNSLDLDDV